MLRVVSRFSYKSVPFCGTNGTGQGSRAHKENGTDVPSRFPSRFGPDVSRLCVPVVLWLS